MSMKHTTWRDAVKQTIALLETATQEAETRIEEADARGDSVAALEALCEASGLYYALNLLRFRDYRIDEWNRINAE